MAWSVRVKFALEDLWDAFTQIPGKTHTEVKTINEGEDGYEDAEYEIAMKTDETPFGFDFNESPKV